MPHYDFLYLYISLSLIISGLVFIIRLSQLKPLIQAKKSCATVVSNHYDRDMLSTIGIKVDGLGTVIHIQPPPYTPDESLRPKSLLEVWTTPELPGVVLAQRPAISLILLKALKPGLTVLFLFFLPALFIFRGFTI